MRPSSKSIPIQKSSGFGLSHFIALRSLLWGAVLGILGFLIYDRWFPPAIDQMVNDRLQAMMVMMSSSTSVLDKDVVILGIDDASLRLDAESVRSGAPRRSVREVVTLALEALHGLGPKVVAVDVLLLDAGTDPGEDDRLEKAIRRYKPSQLLLASKVTRSLSGDRNEERAPYSKFRLQGPGALAPGFVDIPEESDGFARYIQVAGVVKRGDEYPGNRVPKFHQVVEYLALAAARAYKEWPAPVRGTGGWEGRAADGKVIYRVPTVYGQSLPIPFSEYPGSIPVIELADLLADSSNKALASRVAGKLCFWGRPTRRAKICTGRPSRG
jgi:CHASE2 domain-containing sensor protein